MDDEEYRRRLLVLVAAQRARCLWFLRENLDFKTREVQHIALDAIQRHGGLAAFREAGELKRWLSLLIASWDGDRQALLSRGFSIDVVRERPTFVEVVVSRAAESVVLEWSQDSAYRFFPLLEHETLGLTLHPVDLATNKVLALVGRREPRDFVDVLACHESLQPFGFLAWAAAGKDPGYGPSAIVEEAARSARYSQADLNTLDFDGPSPDASLLSRRWHAAVAEARQLIQLLPAERAGTCVLDGELGLARYDEASLAEALRDGRVWFHEGAIRGAFPTARPQVAGWRRDPAAQA